MSHFSPRQNRGTISDRATVGLNGGIPSPPKTIHKRDTSTGSATSTTYRSSSETTAPKSTFKNALVNVPVPQKLLEGVHVLRVSANGVTHKAFLTLSEDKFTLYITTQKVKKGSGGGSTSGWFRKRAAVEEKASGGSGRSAQQETIIDIGAIDRIQRGQTTQKFELAKKSRQDSLRNLMNSASDMLEALDESKRSDLFFLQPQKSFSIIFRGQRTLDLMSASDDVSRDELLDGLDNIVRTYQAAKLKVGNDVLLLRYVWLDVDKDKSGYINCTDLGKVLDRINFQMKRPELNTTYEKFAKIIGLDRSQRRKGLTFEQSCTFLHKIRRDSWLVKPVNEIWNDLFGQFMNNGKPRQTVSARTFLEQFVHKKQRETSVTMADVLRLFERLHQLEIATVADAEPRDPTRIDKNRFEAYLLSRENDVFDPAKERFDRRLMKQPMSEYFINSSHNTYLTGDQFISHSSVEMYVSALYRGCRCLELDIWDGELDQEGRPIPVVWHGHTMTTKILFRDIIRALKVFLNFNPNSYPLILSFENHCSIPYQQVMAQDLLAILGESLYIPNETSLSKLGSSLPAPEELKGFVVIKGRRPPPQEPSEYLMMADDETDDESDDEAGGESVEVSTATPSEATSTSSVTSNHTKITATTSLTTTTTKASKKEKHGVHPGLARLTLLHGTKFKSWDQSWKTPSHHMHSFSESKVRAHSRKLQTQQTRAGAPSKWGLYNQRHITRTYPAGSRVDSSNYSPMLAWSLGCQLVSLNFQTEDTPLRLNDGRFRENGGCGYVLKPSTMMTQEPNSFVPVQLSIRILSGSCIPKPRGQRMGECIHPYVKISVFDVKGDGKETTQFATTNHIINNGFFPIWNSEKYVFSVENGAVAMLHIAVCSRDLQVVGSKEGELIATSSIPFSCLRTGYRSVQLFDAKNTRTGPYDFASLLIEVRRKQLIAEI